MSSAIPVTVIGGYLGAGKTSLVNHLLRSATERIAVLVNDFGAVNIDASLIETADGDTITLANGCICCSLSDGYVSALQTISQVGPPPDRLLIEASGVSDPATVAAYAYTSELTLDGVVLLVDLEQIERQLRDPYIGDVVARQLGQADIIIGNKIDLASDPTKAQAVIASHVDAPQVVALRGEVPLEILIGFDPAVLLSDLGELADDRHVSWSYSFEKPPTKAELLGWLDALGPDVLRVKGVVRLADSTHDDTLVQRVGRRTELTMHDGRVDFAHQLVGISVISDAPLS